MKTIYYVRVEGYDSRLKEKVSHDFKVDGITNNREAQRVSLFIDSSIAAMDQYNFQWSEALLLDENKERINGRIYNEYKTADMDGIFLDVHFN